MTRLPPEMQALLAGLVDQAVEQVTQGLFAQFMAVRADPLGIRARAQAAKDVGARIKALLRDLTHGQ